MKKTLLQSITIIMTILLTVVIQSCSLDNKPELAKNELENRINNQSNGMIKLLSLEKTDGKENNFMGYKSYEMDFKVTIEYQKDCYKSIGVGNWLYTDFVTEETKPTDPWSYVLGAQVVYLPKGKKVEIYGVAGYEQKESGWQLNNIELKRSHDLN